MKNKKLFYFLVAVLLLVVMGVGIWLLWGRVENLKNDKAVDTKESIYYQELSDTYETKTIEKGRVPDEKVVSYSFIGTIVEGLKLEDWGGLTGVMVIDGDELQREISVGLNNDMVYFGIYEGSFEGSSQWKLVEDEKVSEIVTVGTKVSIQMRHVFDGNMDAEDFFFEHDQILDALLSDIVEKKFEYEVPDEFYLHVTKIGVVL